MTDKRVLILGGGSDMGQAIAHRFAKEGFAIDLAARDGTALKAAATDMALRHNVDVKTHDVDVAALDRAEAFFDAVPEPRIVISVVGWMGDQKQVAQDAKLVERTIAANFTGPAWYLEVAAARLAEKTYPSGIIGVSSVAGDRGRATNYWYGASKAGFTGFLSGLRQKYVASDLHVMTVKPGFVATAMTAGMDLPEKLTAQPEEIADGVYKAWIARRNIVYLRGIWRVVMGIICALPEMIFKRTKF